MRNAALVPLATFFFAQLYFTFYPLLTRVPEALFWTVVAIVFSGAVAGVVLIASAARGERMRGRALAWFIAAVVCELICVRQLLAMTLPWL